MRKRGRDGRYSTVKVLLDAGKVKSMKDLFIFMPKTIVFKDLGVNFNRFCRAINDPSGFRIAEIFVLADLFGVEPKVLLDIAYNDIIQATQTQDK